MGKKVQTIKFQEFMSGEYKTKEKKKRQKVVSNSLRVASSAILPVATCGTVGTLGLIATTGRVFACEATPVSAGAQAIPVGVAEWGGEKALSALAHVLDPVIDILVALSFPIASVVIVGACFFFMFGNSEKAWSMIQNAGLGYVLIQVSPVILSVLKQVGNAV
jgi:hypothetical protein